MLIVLYPWVVFINNKNTDLRPKSDCKKWEEFIFWLTLAIAKMKPPPFLVNKYYCKEAVRLFAKTNHAGPWTEKPLYL